MLVVIKCGESSSWHTHILTKADVRCHMSVSSFKSVAATSKTISQNRPVVPALPHWSIYSPSWPQIQLFLIFAYSDQRAPRLHREQSDWHPLILYSSDLQQWCIWCGVCILKVDFTVLPQPHLTSKACKRTGVVSAQILHRPAFLKRKELRPMSQSNFTPVPLTPQA